MQLYHLSKDPAETNNLLDKRPKKVKALLSLLNEYVQNGRSTPGERISNDREITFLPSDVTLP